jgi:hypothetical protein
VAPTHVNSLPAPQSNAGIWIEFDGARWYSAGAAVPFVPDGFTRVGDYGGFPVYRSSSGPADRIFVPAVRGGALTPYARR